MLRKSTLSFAVVALSLAATAAKPYLPESEPLLRVGLIADCQYGHCGQLDSLMPILDSADSAFYHIFGNRR